MGNIEFGKYKLIAELGHGGMADVFLAVQAGPAGSGFRKLTVIKRLRQNLADDPEFVTMLVDEARIAARLNHPHVVQTNEVGSIGNHYFIAMEYLDGQPLHRVQHRSAQRVKNGGVAPLSPGHQYLMLMDVLAGLHHAHELLDYDGSPLEIVHRDMTPQNIFITYEGQVKVVDFGIAKAAGRSSETRQGVVKGKVRYMAPEQALGLPITRRADVFAVGIMLWEAATGTRMWKDRDELQVVRALVSGDLPPSPRDFDPTVPLEIDTIVRKALALRVEDRYATAADFRTDLEQYLAVSGQLLDLRRQIAPMLNELFKDKRAELRSIIETQLASVEDAPSNELALLPQDSGTSSLMSFRPPTMPSDGAPSSLNTNGLAAAKDVVPAVPAPRRRPVGVIIGAVAVAAVVAGVGVWKTTAGSPAVSAASGSPLDAGTVSVQLMVDPPSARVSVDDGPFEPAPHVLHVAKDERPHRMRIEADGYEPKTETLSFARDTTLSFALAHVRSDAPPDPVASAKPVTAPAARPAFVPARPAAPRPTEPKSAEAPPPPSATATQTAKPTTDKPRVNLDKADPWSK